MVENRSSKSQAAWGIAALIAMVLLIVFLNGDYSLSLLDLVRAS